MSRGFSTTVLEETDTYPYGLSAHPANDAMEMELDPQPPKTHLPLNNMNTTSDSVPTSQMPPPPVPQKLSQHSQRPASQTSASAYTFTPLLTGQRSKTPHQILA